MESNGVKIISAQEVISEPINKLIEAAREATNDSYAPYSNFQVGAAVLLADGTVIKGSNFENASYPLCLCAERVALASVHSQYPNSIIKSIAVTAKNKNQPVIAPVAPCGACRQVLLEYEQKQKAKMKIIMCGESGDIAICESASKLLPMAFDHSFLSE